MKIKRQLIRAASWPLLVCFGVIGMFLLCEVLVRIVDVRLFRDVLREAHSVMAIRDDICRSHPGLRFAISDRSWTRHLPHLRYCYRTGNIKIGDCQHGFRLNGGTDNLPVYGVVFGDSQTENVRLDEKECWVSLLSEQSGRRFVNFGMSGTGTSYHRKLANLIIPILRPKLVIVQICVNDMEGDWDEIQRVTPLSKKRLPWETRVIDGVANFLHSWQEKHDLESVVLFSFWHWGLPRLKTMVGHWRVVSPEYGPKNPHSENVENDKKKLQMDNMEKIWSVCRSYGADLAIVSIGPEDYLRSLSFREWCDSRGIPLITDSRIASMGRGMTFLVDGHYNEIANKLLENDIYNTLKDKKWI